MGIRGGRAKLVPARRRIVVADASARLDRIARKPLVVHLEARDVIGAAECALRGRAVTELVRETDIARALRPHPRRIRADRRLHRVRRRQDLVVDTHPLGGVHRLRKRFREHDRDALADANDAIDREQGKRRAKPATAHHRRRDAHAGDVTEPVALAVRAGEDRQHAGGRPRLLRIDRTYPGVCDRRAHHTGTDRGGRREVVDVLAPAGEHPAILEAIRGNSAFGVHDPGGRKVGQSKKSGDGRAPHCVVWSAVPAKRVGTCVSSTISPSV